MIILFLYQLKLPAKHKCNYLGNELKGIEVLLPENKLLIRFFHIYRNF